MSRQVVKTVKFNSHQQVPGLSYRRHQLAANTAHVSSHNLNSGNNTRVTPLINMDQLMESNETSKM